MQVDQLQTSVAVKDKKFATLKNTTQAEIKALVEGENTFKNKTQGTAQCNTLQRTATYCNALQRTAKHCNALQHIAKHCTTL